MAKDKQLKSIVKRAIQEDIPWADITTDSLFGTVVPASANIIAKEEMVISGVEAAEAVFHHVDKNIKVSANVKDGDRANRGQTVLAITGDIRSILKGERTALNFLGHLSGIATITSRFVSKLGGTNVRLCDTRKTTPGIRLLEKKAVIHGGGYNHRFCLSDAVMIKDTHLALFPNIGTAITEAKTRLPHTTKVEVEISSLEDIEPAIAAGADIIMLDNMTVEMIREAVKIIAKRAISEVSGNITLENITRFASTGADVISVGMITHSARSMDLSMKTLGPGTIK